uniref:T. congolense-specific, cell surface-expressed gene family n=1 Tax=Trypanosoma congolense (strain IL3000) TaxID=1068625 RepID=F9WIX1_TRYCI|nr:hypothetical protein, unlikely [Trypanosoma congolense IL3000]
MEHYRALRHALGAFLLEPFSLVLLCSPQLKILVHLVPLANGLLRSRFTCLRPPTGCLEPFSMRPPCLPGFTSTAPAPRNQNHRHCVASASLGSGSRVIWVVCRLWPRSYVLLVPSPWFSPFVLSGDCSSATDRSFAPRLLLPLLLS